MTVSLLRLILVLAIIAAAMLPGSGWADPGVSENLPNRSSAPVDSGDRTLIPAFARDVEELSGEWISLTDRIPDVETTGWSGIGGSMLPVRDFAFRTERPIMLGGSTYPRGVGVYPFSEITYLLDGSYRYLSGVVGPDGWWVPPDARLRFRILGDGLVLWDSGPVHAGEFKVVDSVPVRGTHQLRLLTIDDTDGLVPAPGAWADMRLLPARGKLREPEYQVTQRQTLDRLRHADAASWQQRSAAEASALSAISQTRGVTATFLDGGRLLRIASGQLVATLTLKGPDAGALRLFDRRRSQLVLDGARTQVRIGSRDAVPRRLGFEFAYERAAAVEQTDAASRSLKIVQVGFRSLDGRYFLWLDLGLFADAPTLWYRVTVFGQTGRTEPVIAELLGEHAEVYFGRAPELLLDDGRLKRRQVEPDGIAVLEAVGQGKPALLWDGQGGTGLMVSPIDELARTPRLRTLLPSGRLVGNLQYEIEFQTGSPNRSNPGPRVLLHVGADPRHPASLAPVRDFLQSLYPPRTPPPWARFQWISWYKWFMDVTADRLRSQIDQIADRLADLGPWYVVVDAGWYVAEGREGSDYRTVDPDKFPKGLREVVDYAHERGVRVILYFSSPHLDTREREGDWLGLRSLAEQLKPDLIVLGQSEEGTSYMFNYASPRVLAYLEDLFDRFLFDFGIDGLQLDGLGMFESAAVAPSQLDAFGIVPAGSRQTLDILRLHAEQLERRRPGAYLQTGWDNPVFANSLAHAFWYGDDTMQFRSPYPHPGLLEKIQYALYQHLVLGQRAQLGSIYRNPEVPNINDQWLGAALTIGAPLGLSFDLEDLSPQAAARYRLLLNRYDPWGRGVTADSVLEPGCFARNLGDAFAVSVVNRGPAPTNVRVRLSDCGLDLTGDANGIDLTSWRPVQVRSGTLEATVDREAVHTFLVRTSPGYLTSSSRLDPAPSGIVVSGPADVPGISYLVLPRPPIAVTLGGVPIEETGGRVEFDARTGLTAIYYSHSPTPQTLSIR